MKKMSKSVVVIALIVLNILLLVKTALAAETAKIDLPDVTCKSGETVTVSVNISGNPGLAAVRLKLIYDKSVLQLEKVANGNVFEDGTELFGNNKADVPYYMIWEDALSGTNNKKNGRLAELVFKVSESTKAEKSIVEIEVDGDSTFDKDLKSVQIGNGKATVKISREVKTSFNEKNADNAQSIAKNISNVAEKESVTQFETDSIKETTTNSNDEATGLSFATENRKTETSKTYLIISVVSAVFLLTACILIIKKRSERT